MQLLGLILEWGYAEELLSSFRAFKAAASFEVDGHEQVAEAPTPVVAEEPAQVRKRGRPRLTDEEKAKRLAQRAEDAKTASDPRQLVVDGKRKRTAVNYREIDGGVPDEDRPTAREALTATVAQLEFSEVTKNAMVMAKRAAVLKLLKHLAGFLSLAETPVLLAVMLHPATRTLQVTGLDEHPDLDAHFRGKLVEGRELLQDLLQQELKATDRSIETATQIVSDAPQDLALKYMVQPTAAKAPAKGPDAFILNSFDQAVYNPTFTTATRWWSGQDIALRKVAAPYLAIQASSAASERVFSVVGYVGRARRGRLADFRLEAQTLMKWNSEFVLEFMRGSNDGKTPPVIEINDD
jgi:hypothetical protein